jgi:hypothetical protein
MDEPRQEERRRFPRVPIRREAPDLSLPVSATVQLIDISETGVLLSSWQPLDVGRRAQLRIRIGAEPLNVLVEVRRLISAPRPGVSSYRLGAEFVNLDEESRNKIEGFLRAQA